MSNSSSKDIIKPGLPRGLRDLNNLELKLLKNIISKISKVYESYGFEELSTPAFEFSDALGKFLPDQDRPNAGVFSFQDDDEKWLSLRYDLTAPLARYVGENYDKITKPYKRFQVGSVWRNEKPGPGRFREFLQLDADIVGSDNYLADSELIMLACDCMRTLGLDKNNYSIRVSNRKLLDSILELIANNEQIDDARRLIILRAIDKLDRVGVSGVERLLSNGRKDESGDFTKGAELSKASISKILDFLSIDNEDRKKFISQASSIVNKTVAGQEALKELSEIDLLLAKLDYKEEVLFDSSIVRGLEYYTGTIFEANLQFDSSNDNKFPVIGSIGGGGRYDRLISRFRKDQIGATGFSIGVSRLATILQMAEFQLGEPSNGPVLILKMDTEFDYSYYQIAKELRDEGILAEVYVGSSGMKAQMKYADKKNSPVVIIEGTDEREKGIVTIKNLIKGKEISTSIDSRESWIKNSDIQFEVDRDKLVSKISKLLNSSN
mgnify:FL=1|tara:strand:- start:168 stop:1649 length:1482 start_codon:yes stop_codon:yes gene_type:complete